MLTRERAVDVGESRYTAARLTVTKARRADGVRVRPPPNCQDANSRPPIHFMAGGHL